MSGAEIMVESPAEGVRLLRIHRPEARNALNMAVRRLLVKHIAACSADPGVRCVVLAGDEKAFAAGADIKEMAGAGTVEMMKRGVLDLWRATAASPKPMIAAVRGYALGGGCELAQLCDIIIAGESAKFGQPEIRIGIIPGGGGTQRLTQAIGKHKAMRYLLTGDPFSARDAEAMGLVSEVVADEEVEPHAVAIAARIAAMSPLAVQQIKDVVLRGMDMPLDAALTLETRALHLLFSTQDQKEGMAAFIEKREPVFSGK
ncbi:MULTISPECIES: enoyl-CoA hydratase-related protein [unclassified Variovorax]|uniref:enoyl-CoA hydratase-related protein n=1 Tax=unclassified Variovorax TaxID=663243 RepID=UPI0008C7AEA1|nr:MULTISPECIES: enoyl-CoA hydratase-related protein [unclassified Variovorax]SEK16154.1 short chain enoyl-CoA hydratase [Variovorax sp. OK202]SFE35443.1 short chain enoyl-CoA hydratase [Variovorax sp. OK212]